MPVRVDPKRLKRKRKRGMAPPSGADNQDLVVSLLRKFSARFSTRVGARDQVKAITPSPQVYLHARGLSRYRSDDYSNQKRHTGPRRSLRLRRQSRRFGRR
jgi:IS4 transposase